MGRSRMAAKPCPQCDQQVPVACKTCPCGFSFFAQKRSEQGELKKCDKEIDDDEKKEGSNEEEVKLRRTERTKRLRPDFYNSIEIDKKDKKQSVRRRRTLATNESLDLRKRRSVMLHHASGNSSSIFGNFKQEVSSDKDDDQDGMDSIGEDEMPRKKRGRPKYNKDKNGADNEEAIYDNISPEKSFECSVILADINRKICLGRAMNYQKLPEMLTAVVSSPLEN